MEIYTTGRPSVLLAPACAWSPVSASAFRAPLSQVHQVQIQAELGQAMRRDEGISNKVTLKGRNGFVGSNGSSVVKTDGASGVPPRGRPV
ncbi:hypothetical protein [Actinoplanes sp. NPDC089786]|uniref:hypothetical protein n=1 Tax=Actinoplanes sp. NPDC089786 TaxID=3155185 RepID=UPI00343DEA09